MTAFASVSQPEKTTIGDFKWEVLSGLQTEVEKATSDIQTGLIPDLDPEGEWTLPTVESTDDFELSRALRDRGRPTGQYEVLSNTDTIKQSVPNWETLFIQFKDEHGM